MNQALHQQIAHAALERKWLTTEVVCEILFQLGQRYTSQLMLDADVWLEEGWLSPEQFEELVDGLRKDFSEKSKQQLMDAVDAQSAEEAFLRANTMHYQPIENGAQTSESNSDIALPDQTLTASPAISPLMTNGIWEKQKHYTNGQLPHVPVSDGKDAVGEPEEHAFERTQTTVYSSPTMTTYVPPKQRYVLGDLLGSGGGGRVVRAYDRILGRTLAMKIIWPEAQQSPQGIARFLAEAQATGQIEHPNIVPIYDFGVLESGEIFYTMREVRRHSLREVLEGIKHNDAHYCDEYTLVRLLTIFKQVCLAVHYAHVRGVIHRDLKPGNIMLGDYGEVLVMDWGLARILDKSVQTNLSRQGGDRYHEGQTLGTPAYMPPEQARGELDQVDEQSDIYSLGAILYEMLAMTPAFSGESPIEIMWKVVDQDIEPPSKRAPNSRPIADELERICLTAMNKEKNERFGTAKELHDRIEDWMEGIQIQEAHHKVKEGHEATRNYLRFFQEIQDLEKKVRRIAAHIEDWEPIERKQELWQLEDRCEKARAAAAHAFGLAVSCFTQALAYHSESEQARMGLVDLYWRRFQEAEALGNVSDTIYFKSLVKQYDTGKYTRLIDGQVNLRVFTEPEGAQVTLFAFEEHNRRLIEHRIKQLGTSPIKADDLAIGSYLLLIEHPDHPPVRHPVLLERGRDANIHIKLPDCASIQNGFVFVPASECIIGGDPEAIEPAPLQRVYVPSFFCAEYPVTFGDYLEWINELHQHNPKEALERAPQTRGSEGLLIHFDKKKKQWVPGDILIEGPARELYPIGQDHEYALPVVGIRAEDAEAYCEWLGKKHGRPYRLPTEHELEKCGRGVDGRWFPWGSSFDATFCKMNASRSEMAQLEPVGAFESDLSPYGIRDLAGGVREWCCAEDKNSIERATKGGTWGEDARACRMASRIPTIASARVATIGLRLVYSFDET